MRLIERLKALEHLSAGGELLTREVDGLPTADQTAMIDRCARTGRRLIVFCEPGNTAWMPGYGVPPWEVEHGNA